MYGIKYKVPFKTLSGRDSVVTLEERGYAGSVIELKAGGDPFNISVDQADLLSPIRSSTATLAVVGSDYLQDLYTNDPQGIRVKCEVDGVVKWLGYLLPDTFAQDFSSPEFEYDMELVAALSTLKYREFDLTDDFVTFRQIIEKAVEYSGYEAIYLTNSVRTETGKFYDLKISSSNFFDELGEASTYYEALEEIAKYLGCCFVPHEDDLCLLDYAAIRKGFNSYTRIVGGSVSNVTLSDAKVVDNYKGTGAKISRIAGKNKATVNCSLYEIKEILPPFNDERSEFVKMKDDFTQTIREGKEDVVYRGIIRYFTQPRYTFYQYPFLVDSEGVPSSDPVGANAAGSTFVKTSNYNSDEIPSKLNFTNEIQVKMYVDRESALLGKHLSTASPIIKISSGKKVFVHAEVWFCISFLLKYNTSEWVYQEPKEYGVIDVYNRSHKARFRIGDWYYTGSGWSTTPSDFRMPVRREKGERSYGTYFGLENTNTFDTGLGDLQGYTFKAPDFPLMGDCELTLYAYEEFPVSPLRTFGMHYFYYKDLEVSYGIPNEQSIYGDWVDKDSKNDVLYENEISGEYVEKADEIGLKICSNTDGKLAFSSVIEGNGFLDKLVSDAYGKDLPEHLLLDRVEDMFKKPRFVIDPTLKDNAKPYTLFTEPHLGKTFLLAGGEIDAKRESATYNLIEL